MTGSRSQVVRQYRRLQDVLARELGEPPAAGDRRDLPPRDVPDRPSIGRASLARSSPTGCPSSSRSAADPTPRGQSGQLVDQFLDRRGGRVEGRLLVGGQLDLEDRARCPDRPRTTGTPTNRPSTPNSPLSRTRARQDALPVEQDRLDHLERATRPARRTREPVLSSATTSAPPFARPLLERLDAVGRQQLGDRHAGDGRVARQRDHRVAVAAEHERVGVLDADAQLLRR